LESFDNDWLRNFNKLQITRAPQVEMIAKSLNAGVVFSYGLMVDVSTRSIADLRRELNFITGTRKSQYFFCHAFDSSARHAVFLRVSEEPNSPSRNKTQDMDGTTILQYPVDPIDEVVKFVGDLQSMKGFQGG